MHISGKVVLITGGSEGIGAATAAEFAASGARLALTARSEEKLRAAAPTGALVVPGDLTNAADRARIVDTTLSHYGTIDILINNAGAGYYQPSWEMPLDEVRALMDLNPIEGGDDHFIQLNMQDVTQAADAAAALAETDANSQPAKEQPSPLNQLLYSVSGDRGYLNGKGAIQ